MRTRHHREWDKRVRAVAGGLTILKPGLGQWEHEGELFRDRVIPVRVKATRDQMKTIADITIQHYEQIAVMYYMVSEMSVTVYATDSQREAFRSKVGGVEEQKPETAFCMSCSWEGMTADMQSKEDAPLEELCPVCGSTDTWWGKPDGD